MDKIQELIRAAIEAERKKLTEEFASVMDKEFEKEGIEAGAASVVKELNTRALNSLISEDVKLTIKPEQIAEAIAESTPKITPIPEQLAALFNDAEMPTEEEINGILGAVEADKIAKTVGSVNEKLAEAKIEGTVNAEKLAEIKEFVNPALYEKIVEGDLDALTKIKSLLIVEVKETEEEKEIDPEAERKSVFAGYKEPEENKGATSSLNDLTPEAIAKQREADFKAEVENYRASAEADGIEGPELEKRVKDFETNLIDILKTTMGQ